MTPIEPNPIHFISEEPNMRKLIRSLVLATAVATGTATLVTYSPVIGQNPKVDPKTKVEPKTGTPKGSVLVSADKQGKFRFFIKDGDGKTLAMSTVGYEKKEDAMKMIETVKTLLNTQKVTEEK
jgi:uncharacterized protein YegP (UPF0339 family)